jgi:hypothetical protein
MPFVASSIGSGSNNTAGTTYAFQVGGNFSPNAMAVLCVSYDNSGTNGADPYTSIQDSLGNTWTSRQNVLNDPGTANAGVTLRIFTSNLSNGRLQSTSSVTMSFGISTTAKSFVIMQISSSLISERVEYVSGGTATGASTTGSVTGFVSNSNLIIGAVGREANTTRNADTDTTNGSWSSAQAIGVGTTTAGNEIISQRKLVTASGDQTYNPTFGTSADWGAAFIVVRLSPSSGVRFIQWISSNDDY